MLTLAKGVCLRRESFTAPDEVANGPNLTLTVTNPPGTSSGVIRHLVPGDFQHGLPSSRATDFHPSPGRVREQG